MLARISSPLLQRRNTPSPSPQLNWRNDGTPYHDNCPPTPVWDNTSMPGSPMTNHTSDYATLTQIAWTAYQNCTRRMNGACAASRTVSQDEQRAWWEESSSICLNAILLHRATINKQSSLDLEKHLEALENAYYMIQKMLESCSAKQQAPACEIKPRTESVSTSTSLFDDDEPMPEKRSKRLGLSAMVGRVMGMVSIKDSPRIDTEPLAKPEALLY